MQKKNIMPKKRGRKAKNKNEKVQIMQAYLTPPEQNKIKKKFGNLTEAVREKVLPECEQLA